MHAWPFQKEFFVTSGFVVKLTTTQTWTQPNNVNKDKIGTHFCFSYILKLQYLWPPGSDNIETMYCLVSSFT